VILVHMNDGSVHKVKGDRWTEPPLYPPEIPGTFQNAEIEVDKQQAAEIRAELVKSLRNREPLVYGRDWTYRSLNADSMFIVVYRDDEKVASFNPTEVDAIYGENDGELADPDDAD